MTQPEERPDSAGTRRLRVAVGVLSVLVAVVCGVLLWLLLGPFHAASVQRHRLACQVEGLGGHPIGGLHCPRTPHPTPAPTHQHGAASPSPQLTPGPGTTTVVRPTPPGHPSATHPAANPRATHHHSSGHPPAHSPPPQPLACATVGPLDACLDKPLPAPSPQPWRHR